MKKFLIASMSVALLISCGEQKDENAIVLGKSYGPVKVDTAQAMTVKEMLDAFDGNKGEQEFTFIAPIDEVCAKAGCWINVDKGNGETFMVRFKDHPDSHKFFLCGQCAALPLFECWLCHAASHLFPQ